MSPVPGPSPTDAPSGEKALVPSLPRPVPDPVFDRARLDAVFRLVSGQVERGDLPAAALAIAGPRGIVRAEAFGRDGDRGVGVDDRFPVASITKPIVATSVIQLVEDGLLTLAEPIAAIVPEYAPPPGATGGPGGEAVTAWHLLTHTSGSTDVPGDVPTSTALRVSAAIPGGPAAGALLRRVGGAPLAFAPGSAYRYASDPFIVLGEVVRRLRGTATFGEALRASLLEPLGMRATGFAPEVDGQRSVRPHVVGLPDEESAAIGIAMAAVEHPGGGLWSTVGDLARFGRAMLLGGTLDGIRVLGRAWLDVMTREQTGGMLEPGTPPGRPGYGLGWSVAGEAGPYPGWPRRFGHRGASGSYLCVDPGNGLVIVLLGDLWGAPDRLQDAVVDATYGALA